MAIVFGVSGFRFEASSSCRIWADKGLNAPADWLVFKATLAQRALVWAPFPAQLLEPGAVGFPTHSATHDAVFGARRSGTRVVPLITGLEREGKVAVVLRAEWTEGGGEGWVGSPSQKNAYTGAGWVDKAALEEWAKKLAEVPLFRKLFAAVEQGGTEVALHPYTPKYIEESDLDACEVVERRHYLRDDDGTISRVVRVRLWGEEVSLRVRQHGLWWARTGAVNAGAYMAFTVTYTRGAEEVVVWDDGQGQGHSGWGAEAPAGRPFAIEDAGGTVEVRFAPESEEDTMVHSEYEVAHARAAEAFLKRNGLRAEAAYRGKRVPCKWGGTRHVGWTRLALSPAWAAKAVEAGGTIVT